MRRAFVDLDGTLTDPSEGITACFEYAAERLGIAIAGDMRRFIGPPLRDSFREIMGADDAPVIAEAIRLYRERFGTTGIFENTLYEGVPEALESLARAGILLDVVTAKPQVYARRIVKHFGLADYFEGVYGPSLDGHPATKAELLGAVMATTRAIPSRACMVGDRSYDMIAARVNGIAAVGVGWGYGTERELKEAGAGIVVESVGELARIVSQLLL